VSATFDSQYILGMFNRLTGRTGTDSITDPNKYLRLSEAQNEVIADMAAICPHVLYPTVATASLPQLTISAAGDIGTFGSDANGYAKFPMGHGNLFESLADIPGRPFTRYLNEGTQIRALNGTALPATLYWYGVSQPADMDATNQPSIMPEAARELIAIRAAYNFGTEGNRNTALSQTMAARYGYPLSNATGRFAFWCLSWKTQYAGGGAVSVTGLSLALSGGQYGRSAWAT
jgi:hypothetical protein